MIVPKKWLSYNIYQVLACSYVIMRRVSFKALSRKVTKRPFLQKNVGNISTLIQIRTNSIPYRVCVLRLCLFGDCRIVFVAFEIAR